MEMLIAKLTEVAIAAGVTEAGLMIVIIFALSFLYRYLFSPMHEKIKIIPSHDDIYELIEKNNSKSLKDLREVIDQLDIIEGKLDRVDEYENITDINIKDLRRDIEAVKTILNQFQGHMMYSGRRSGDFGNEELK